MKPYWTTGMAPESVHMGYQTFLQGKERRIRDAGRSVAIDEINPLLYGFQRQVAQWALRKGRCAIFADCGLGKTFMQLEWARLTGELTLVIAPLAVAQQTVSEGAKLGMKVKYARGQEQADGDLTVTNYEMVDHFDISSFGAVILDESSILKSVDGKTRTKLIELCKDVPFHC